MEIGKILLLLGSVGSFIFLAASAGGNYWIKNDRGGNSGLWKFCSGSTCRSSVGGMFDAPSWYDTCRAFSILSCLAAVGGILFAFIGMISKSVKGMFASIFLFGAAFCMMIALALYTNKSSDVVDLSGISYGWSYILGWIGLIGAGCAGVIGLVAERF